MANDKTGTPRPFDVGTIEHLIGLMAQHDLAEIALQEGEQRIRLRKAVAAPPVAITTAAPVTALPPPATVTPAVPATAAPASKLLEIKSEMVGSFYTRPGPGKDEYVKFGSIVKPETVVCVIVAMKVNNEIQAGVSGKIVEICVQNEASVDYGVVLFRVDPS